MKVQVLSALLLMVGVVGCYEGFYFFTARLNRGGERFRIYGEKQAMRWMRDIFYEGRICRRAGGCNDVWKYLRNITKVMDVEDVYPCWPLQPCSLNITSPFQLAQCEVRQYMQYKISNYIGLCCPCLRDVSLREPPLLPREIVP